MFLALIETVFEGFDALSIFILCKINKRHQSSGSGFIKSDSYG
jgi:hypothetical protein